MSKFPIVYQGASHDCVPACVLALGRYYGVNLNLNEVRRILVTNPINGTKLRNLDNLSTWFHVRIGKIVDTHEISVHTPFIAYLRYSHAVVIWSYLETRGKLIVGDPAAGIVEMDLVDLMHVWEGIAVVIRPKVQEEQSQQNTSKEWYWLRWYRYVGLSDLLSLGVRWTGMILVSFVVFLSALANSIYSLLYAQLLPFYSKFLVFVVAYTLISLILGWISNFISLRISVKYQRLISWRIDEAMKKLNLRFYTMGDISTRYQDVSTVVNAMLALFQNIPYSLIIFLASLYFLMKINWFLPIFTLAFLILVVSILTPFVHRVRNLLYSVRLKQAELTNCLQRWLAGGENAVTKAFQELVSIQYKQSIWGLPINSVVGNSVVVPTLFVVIFEHWNNGGTAISTSTGYSHLLTAIMIMNYAVSAGHNLYGAVIAWQTSRPSLHRLKDFLCVDAQSEEVDISPKISLDSFIAPTKEEDCKSEFCSNRYVTHGFKNS
ncbi:peptidase C39 bacteriocin processing [Alicyclobacillus hesperidum URH17-3-68]|uniref:cysteine peptidase family C39 domain-containing protein n=1 Tax=Alicyclobacillus hesperidum TaxID=89784 RepID=UPI000281B616|nr:cysteine peptidase family C39 domain-containing protein [Alicyclobacillus hesperidum]EJY55690.1 peptidase C39 bacteriocin processing [Alicyclobacillus hesperidum URH17-3-68]